MYLKDPRASWTPAMAHYFHVAGDESMFDLTPARVEALVAATDATVNAAADPAATRPKRRVVS